MPTPFTNTEKLALFRDSFPGRDDIHGTRDLGTGRGRCVKSRPTDRVLLDHLRGRQPVGIYPLVVDRCRFAAIDLDHDDTEPVFTLDRLARDLDLPPLIERSKSKGWHLWWFSDQEGWPAAAIRRLLTWMTAEAGLPGVEIFPKQDRLSGGGFGNFIYLPLDGRLVPEGRTMFVQAERSLSQVADPWTALANRERHGAAQIDRVLASLDLDQAAPAMRPCRDTPADAATTGRARCGGPAASHASDAESQGQGGGRGGAWPLPPCAQRMLAEGVDEHQRVACFRLAVHLHRIGLPQDLAVAALDRWASKNHPPKNRRVITEAEIRNQIRDGYSGQYSGYGCDDPVIADYCGNDCPFRRNHVATATSPSSVPLKG